MNDVFHHIPEHEQISFINQLYQKMEHGSSLLFKDIDADDKFFLIFNKMHDLVLSKELGNEISLKKCLQILKGAGFEVKKHKKTRMLLYSHYLVVAEKPRKNRT